MSRRVLSNHPSAIRSRERRLDTLIKAQERAMYAEVQVHMDKGLTFDEAWVAIGGLIIPDDVAKPSGVTR